MVFFRSGEDGKVLGCVTDKLPDGSYLTVPVFASYCSRHCYLHHVPKTLNRIGKCPYEGVKHETVDPVLQRFF